MIVREKKEEIEKFKKRKMKYYKRRQKKKAKKVAQKPVFDFGPPKQSLLLRPGAMKVTIDPEYLKKGR